MVAKLSIDEHLLKQLQESGELQVENTHGVPLVLMTVDARRQLKKIIYDDGDWTEEEQDAVLTASLDDPDDWGHADMDIYDELYGDKSSANGKDQQV